MATLEEFQELARKRLFRKLYTGAWETAPRAKVSVSYNGKLFSVTMFFDDPRNIRWRKALLRTGRKGILVSMRYLDIVSTVRPKKDTKRKRKPHHSHGFQAGGVPWSERVA